MYSAEVSRPQGTKCPGASERQAPFHSALMYVLGYVLEHLESKYHHHGLWMTLTGNRCVKNQRELLIMSPSGGGRVLETLERIGKCIQVD